MKQNKTKKTAATQEIVIEKGIPLPGYSRQGKYPWRRMAVGDSVFILGKIPQNLSGSHGPIARKLGFKFAARTVDGGVRVWRIK